MDSVTLMAELWFEHEPRPDLDALAAAVPGAERAGEAPALAHPQFQHTDPDGRRTSILTGLMQPERDGERPPDTTQTWDWEEADEALARCTHSLLVAELFGRVHAAPDRLAAYLPVLNAAIEQLSPTAIWLPNSERVARPGRLDALGATVNVRMFRVDGSDRSLMDTLGLHALGLPDAQCVFDADEPASIAGLLYDVAGYLLEAGDVIEDGDTIGNRPWRCTEGESVVAPPRRAITLSTDPPETGSAA